MKKIIYSLVFLIFVHSILVGAENESDYVNPSVLVLNFVNTDSSNDNDYGDIIRTSLYALISQTNAFYLSEYSSFVDYENNITDNTMDNTIDNKGDQTDNIETNIIDKFTVNNLRDLCFKSNSQVILYGSYSVDEKNHTIKIEYKTFYLLNNLNNMIRQVTVNLEKNYVFSSIKKANEEYLTLFKEKYPSIKKRLIMNIIEREKLVKKIVNKEVLTVKKYIKQRNMFTIGTSLTGSIFIALSIVSFGKLGWFEYQNGTPYANPNNNSNLSEVMLYIGYILFAGVDLIGLFIFAGLQLKNYIRWRKYGEFTPEQFKEWKKNKRKKRVTLSPILKMNFLEKNSSMSLGLAIKL